MDSITKSTILLIFGFIGAAISIIGMVAFVISAFDEPLFLVAGGIGFIMICLAQKFGRPGGNSEEMHKAFNMQIFGATFIIISLLAIKTALPPSPVALIIGVPGIIMIPWGIWIEWQEDRKKLPLNEPETP